MPALPLVRSACVLTLDQVSTPEWALGIVREEHRDSAFEQVGACGCAANGGRTGELRVSLSIGRGGVLI